MGYAVFFHTSGYSIDTL